MAPIDRPPTESLALSDLQLFAANTQWLLPRLQTPTLEGLVSWLSVHLRDDAAARLRRILVLDHPERLRAEDHVCRLLDRKLTASCSASYRSAVPDRGVDWPRTYLASYGRAPSEVWCSRVVELPDRALLGALAGLAAGWSAALAASSAGRHQRRAERLEAASQRADALGARASSYAQIHDAKIQRIDPEAARAIRRVNALPWLRLAEGERSGLRDAVQRLGTTLLTNGERDSTLNSLLEVSVQLGIIRAAVEAPQADWPTARPWRLIRPPGGSRRGAKYVTAVLRSGELVCEVSKGAPFQPGQAIVDGLRPLRLAAGVSHSPRQPDIRLSFHHAARPHTRVFVLADAKRNASGTGAEYIKESLDVAVLYLLAYARELGLALDERPCGLLSGPIWPPFTLFFRKAASRPADPRRLIARLRRPLIDERVPVLSLFMDDHFGLQAREPDHASPVLSAWLGAVARQAAARVGVGTSERGPNG